MDSFSRTFFHKSLSNRMQSFSIVERKENIFSHVDEDVEVAGQEKRDKSYIIRGQFKFFVSN